MAEAGYLFGDSDEFERGFTLGIVWQQLRGGLDRVDVVVPVSLVRRAVQLGQAVGYRVTVRRPHGLPGLRFCRFRPVRKD